MDDVVYGQRAAHGLHVHEVHGAATFILSGELDIAACETVRDHVARCVAAGAPRIVFDVAQLSFVDCGGLRALAGAAHEHGVEVWLRTPSDAVQRLARVVGVGPTGWRGDPAAAEVRLS